MSRKKDSHNKKRKHAPPPDATGTSFADSDDDRRAPDSESEANPASQAGQEESAGRQDNYGEQIYLRMTTREHILTREQLDALIGHLHEQYPHHARLIFLMREIGLWLSLGLGLHIGDFAVPGIVRIARGWSDEGEFPVPGYARGQFQQGIFSPAALPVPASAQVLVVDQIAFLDAKGFPTGPNDWLFPGRNTKHPWGPGAFRINVLRPALRNLELPDVSSKELYFSIMRVRIQDLAAMQAQRTASQPTSRCPTCGQDTPRPSSDGLPPPMRGSLHSCTINKGARDGDR